MAIDNFDEKNILLNLTAEQKKYIYEEEKFRLEQASSVFPKKYLLYIISYVIGCFLIYFGIANSLFDLFSTGKWIYKPESDFFEKLFNSTIELIRPFLIVIVLSWPILLVYGLWAWGDEIYKKLFKK